MASKTTKFTVNLSENEIKLFEEIRNDLRLSSKAATLKELLNIYERYKSLAVEKSNAVINLQQKTAELSELQKRIDSFFEIMESLKSKSQF